MIKGKPRPFPEHSDYITTITDLMAELQQPVNFCWVKGHQDDGCPYDKLSREARLNVDVDELATKHYASQQQPMQQIDHIQSQLISLSINGKRFPSNWDTNLRWHINGFYMKRSLMTKYGWTEEVWKTIDFTMVKAYLQHNSIYERNKWFKFMHDLQPLGKRKQLMKLPGQDVSNRSMSMLLS
jgi:hypothetical protein